MLSCHRRQFSSKADSSALNVGTLFLLRFPFVEKEQGQFRLGTSDMTWGDQQMSLQLLLFLKILWLKPSKKDLSINTYLLQCSTSKDKESSLKYSVENFYISDTVYNPICCQQARKWVIICHVREKKISCTIFHFLWGKSSCCWNSDSFLWVKARARAIFLFWSFVKPDETFCLTWHLHSRYVEKWNFWGD